MYQAASAQSGPTEGKSAEPEEPKEKEKDSKVVDAEFEVIDENEKK
jgi:hypothetical protein